MCRWLSETGHLWYDPQVVSTAPLSVHRTRNLLDYRHLVCVRSLVSTRFNVTPRHDPSFLGIEEKVSSSIRPYSRGTGVVTLVPSHCPLCGVVPVVPPTSSRAPPSWSSDPPSTPPTSTVPPVPQLRWFFRPCSLRLHPLERPEVLLGRKQNPRYPSVSYKSPPP